MDLASFRNEIARVVAAIQPARRTPMHHEIWLRACAEAINPDDEFEIIVAGDQQNASAAAPFRHRKSLLTRRLFLLGAEDVWLHSDVLYEDERSARHLAEAVVHRGLPARFGHFPGESLFADALQKAARGKGFVVADAVAGSPYIRLDESWREPEQKLKAKRRSDLRRRRKKAEKAHGELLVEILTPGPEEVEALFDETLVIETRGWKGRAGTALKFDQAKCAFFRSYLALASDAGLIRIALLRIAGKTAAFSIGAVCDGAFWGFRTGYDEAYSECSPGFVLFIEQARYAAEAGLSTIEFLGQPEPWTKEWTTAERPKLRLRFYPYNLAGAGAFVGDGLHVTARRVESWVQSRASCNAA